ncbi:MAG TPA: SpoIVB peptidase S55 domain-containing protein [Candidatus Bipolaricaulota bacterium]
MLKRFVLVSLGLWLAGMAWASAAEDQFLMFEDLQVGMEGIGKTIVRGNEIRTFQARIVGLIDSPGELNDFIEIRVSGDAIRESGGVASGMSGSPIYVDGKLIGALSRAIAFDSDPSPFALVTPIGPMLKLLDPARRLAAAALQEQQAKVIELDPTQAAEAELQGYTRLQFVDALPSAQQRLVHPDRLYAVSIATPVLVSGMDERAFAWFSQGIPQDVQASLGQWLALLPGRDAFLDRLSLGLSARYPVQMVNTGLPARQATPAGTTRRLDDLVAGGAVGVTLADGDVTVGAIGTVTYREDDVILAFGHPFLFTGDVEYFLTRAYIYDTVANLQVPFKFGTTTERVGALLQDRFQGIAGTVGTKPRSVRMNVRITDGQSGEVSHYSIDLVRDNTYLASLAFSASLSLLDNTLNRVGKGTLSVDYTIRGAGLPRRLERSDIFASHNDIAVPGPLQVAQVIFLLSQNEFQDPQLDTIDVDISFIPEVKAARLLSIKTDQEVYRPGDTVRYTATFLPFRGEPFESRGEIRIPEGVRSTRLTLHLFGGPRPSSNSSDNNGSPVFDNLEQIIDLVEQLNRNDQLTAELLGIPADDLGRDEQPHHLEQIKGWVISGESRVALKLEPAAPPEAPQEQQEEPQVQEPPAEPENPADEEPQTPEEPKDACKQLFFC